MESSDVTCNTRLRFMQKAFLALHFFPGRTFKVTRRIFRARRSGDQKKHNAPCEAVGIASDGVETAYLWFSRSVPIRYKPPPTTITRTSSPFKEMLGRGPLTRPVLG